MFATGSAIERLDHEHAHAKKSRRSVMAVTSSARSLRSAAFTRVHTERVRSLIALHFAPHVAS